VGYFNENASGRTEDKSSSSIMGAAFTDSTAVTGKTFKQAPSQDL